MPDQPVDYERGIIFAIGGTPPPATKIPFANITNIASYAEAAGDGKVRLHFSFVIAEAELHTAKFQKDKSEVDKLAYLPFKGAGQDIDVSELTDTELDQKKGEPAFVSVKLKFNLGKIGGAN